MRSVAARGVCENTKKETLNDELDEHVTLNKTTDHYSNTQQW